MIAILREELGDFASDLGCFCCNPTKPGWLWHPDADEPLISFPAHSRAFPVAGGWGRAKWGRSDCEPFQSRPPSHREQRPGGKVLWEKWWQFGWWFHQIDGWSLLSSLLPDQVGQLGLHLWSAREVEAAKLQGPCSLRTPRGIGDESGQWFEAWLLRGLLPCMSLEE